MNQESNPRPPISPGCSKAFIFVVGRLFPLSFGLGGLVFLGVGFWAINKGMQSENWDKGTATITSSEIEKQKAGARMLKGLPKQAYHTVSELNMPIPWKGAVMREIPLGLVR